MIERVRVWLIFWGRDWMRTDVAVDRAAVTFDVLQILMSPYLSGLHQYRASIGYRTPNESGLLEGLVTVASDLGSSPPDPPTFLEPDALHATKKVLPDLGEVTTLIENLLLSETIAAPTDPNRLYVVVLPDGVGCSVDKNWTYGLHYAIAKGYPEKVHIAWVGNCGSRAVISSVFSHELVEAITDPEGDAIKATNPGRTCGNPDPTNWCEIGDVCQNAPGQTSTGVTVQGYWSELDQRCVTPTT